jgi:hypothetical protein
MLGNILIIENKLSSIERLKNFFYLYGYPRENIFISSDISQGLEIFKEMKYDISLILFGNQNNSKNNLYYCKLLKEAHPKAYMVLITSEQKGGSINANFIDYIFHKPFNLSLLRNFMRNNELSTPYKVYQDDPRIIDGKYKIGIVKTSGLSPIHALVCDQSNGGCGLTLTSANGLRVHNRINLSLSK